MRDRFVTWGTRDGERRLFIFELDAEEAQIIRREVPSPASTDDFMQTILNAWNHTTTLNYPEGTTKEVVELTTSGTIVPDGAEVEDKVRIASAERGWPDDVLSARVKRQFESQFEELRDVVHGLEAFDAAIFERLKGAWNTVQHELNEKVLRYEQTHRLRKVSDELFARMKELRRGKEKESRGKSKEVKKTLRAKLAAAQAKLEAKTDLHKLFQELKQVQQEVNKAQLTRDDRNALRKGLDELFKATKSEINATGADAGAITQQRTGLEKRLAGLEHAIKRMKHSVHRDNQDIFYENKRIQRAGNQLAEQLGAAKLTMLNERVGGKQAKLDDMLKTEADLNRRLDKLRKREEKAQARREASRKPAGAPVASSDGTGGRTLRERRRGPRVPRAMIADVAAALVVADEE